MEIPSPFTGKMIEIYVKNGDKINQGDDLLLMKVTELVEAEQEEKTDIKIEQEPAITKNTSANNPTKKTIVSSPENNQKYFTEN